MPAVSLTAWAHGRGIGACEAKAKEIASTLTLRGPVADIGGTGKWRNARAVAGGDFNTELLPLARGSQDLVVCEQVIEHLHNITHFLFELHRVLMPGGHLLLATENLASWPNRLALLCGKAPFSLQPICGRFVGGWNDREANYAPTWHNTPEFSGEQGHNRVMTTNQLKALLWLTGFRIESTHHFMLGHYVLLHARKEER
jgi:SAM-dependent methyltransferase